MLQDGTQLTDTILMISPSSFALNPETLLDNKFQPTSISEDEAQVRDTAMAEFAGMVQQLRDEGIEVIVCPTRQDGVVTPDAVFPNNWISFHENGVILYPMKAPNRRAERQLDTVKLVLSEAGKVLDEHVLDLSELENDGHYLEGTGSLVIDRPAKVAFANISERTNTQALNVFSQKTGYETVLFTSNDRDGNPIYHTNVVMSIGEGFTVICLAAIKDTDERQVVASKLQALGKEIIDITLDQLHNFCGNILQVKSKTGEQKIVMSQTAYDAFTPEQREALARHGSLVPVSIPTIERIGGGSARCMMAEVFGV